MRTTTSAGTEVTAIVRTEVTPMAGTEVTEDVGTEVIEETSIEVMVEVMALVTAEIVTDESSEAVMAAGIVLKKKISDEALLLDLYMVPGEKILSMTVNHLFRSMALESNCF